ncbi:MAG TPA: DUF2271 domain-containing protein [Bryobacteraceae bacterium]|nr:DUF2271 domain-containing protein [Bryobacteraceae bacterium]
MPRLFPAAVTPAASYYEFRRDHILGTSFDLVVEASSLARAEDAEREVLAEITRLSRVLSTYTEAGEASRLNRAEGTFPVSAELLSVLAAYELWGRKTGGALTCGADFELDPTRGVARRTGKGQLNIDALGKAWILESASRAGRRSASAVLLDIGGDIVVESRSGESAEIDVADPLNPWENARPLTRIRVSRGSVATSGTSMRGRHIVDPRSGLPATEIASATVVADNAITANALSTAACVLGSQDGLRLIEETAGAEGLLVTDAGRQLRSSGFAQLEKPLTILTQAASQWPSGYEVTIEVPLTASGWKRPYLAVWVEDTKGRLVRNVGLFANKPRYLNELREWYSVNATANTNWRSVARPTRGPGKYSFVWDGIDESGKPAPQGPYRVFVECAMEHGSYYRQFGTIECGATPAEAMVKRTGYFDEVAIQYGPKAGRA